MKLGYSSDLIICHSTPFLVCASVALSGYVWDNTGNLSVAIVVLTAMLMVALVTVHLADRVRTLKLQAFRSAASDAVNELEPREDSTFPASEE